MERREQGASPGNEAPQDFRTGVVGDVSAVAALDYTTSPPPGIPQSICPRCAFCGPHRVGPGTPPHYQRLVCGACTRFLRWLPKPRPVAQGGQP